LRWLELAPPSRYRLPIPLGGRFLPGICQWDKPERSTGGYARDFMTKSETTDNSESICKHSSEVELWYVGRALLGYIYFPQVISSVNLKLSPDECYEGIQVAEKSGCF
jgi:hypothetical protein